MLTFYLAHNLFQNPGLYHCEILLELSIIETHKFDYTFTNRFAVQTTSNKNRPNSNENSPSHRFPLFFTVSFTCLNS